METTNIYVLIDPETQQVRYVGKANNVSQRYKAHLNRARKHQIHKLNWINSLKKKKLKPILEVIDVVSVKDWVFWEKYWIAQMKSWNFSLLNYTEGGDGCTFGNKTSFKKGHKPWNSGNGNKEVCLICNNEFFTTKSSVKQGRKTCGYKCSKILKSQIPNKGTFKKGIKVWNKGIIGIKLKPDKNVFQYSAYTGEFIKEWKTAKEASLSLLINETGIGHVCRGTAKSAGGFIWKYYKQQKIEIMKNLKLKIL